MDNQYHQSAFMPMSSSNSQHAQQQQPPQQHYAPYSASPQTNQQQSSASANNTENPTLPPLQSSGHSYQLPSIYTNAAYVNASHGSHTPTSTSSASHNPHAFSHLHHPTTSGSMLPPSTSYVPVYPNTQASSQAPPSSSMASNMPSSRLPDLRPAQPSNTYGHAMTPFPSYGAPNMQQNQYLPSQEQEPTHVVGSQGRRGILPSLPGREKAPTSPGAAASTKSMIPQKDADGKFPCPHCTKTYLHAKHLKRHLLRHTGDRPYMCHLCKDTFSRSDILKRHFQKCSIRRGNPTGANHLAHQRRNTNPSNRLSLGSEPIGLAGMPGVGNTAPFTSGEMVNGSTHSPTVGNDQSSYASSIASASNRSSRANSLIQPPGMHADARHLSGLGLNNMTSGSSMNGDHMTPTASSFGSATSTPGYTMRPHSASNPIAHGYGYGSSMSNGLYTGNKSEDQNNGNYAAQSGQPSQNRSSGVDWNNVFTSNGQDNFLAQQQGEHPSIPKSEHAMDGQQFGNGESQGDSFMGSLYSHPPAYGDDSEHHQTMPLATR